ncbi:MAG: hypothetical protein ACTS2F_04920 [Thainema sp.]
MKPLGKWLWIVWARVCSFFQASSRTVGLSSLIALLIAIALFPTWHRIFTVRDLPVQIKMAAPQEEYVRVYWDHPERHPDAFERIEVRQNLLPNQTLSKYKFSVVRTPWQRLQIVGENGTNLRIPLAQVAGKQIQKQGQDFQLPISVWNRLSRALVTTGLSWGLMTFLFISVIHIWQRKSNGRFGVATYILTLSITLSSFWTLLFYPGVLSFDSVNHWVQGLQNEYDAWWPPILAMVMHATQYWSKDPSLFTFIQGFLFWASSLYLLWQIVGKSRFFLINASLFVFVPPIWLYSNATVSNSWMTIFVLLSANYLVQFCRQQRRRFFLLSICFLSIAICFRREAIFLVAIPIAIYLYWSSKSDRSLSSIGRRGAIILSILLLSVIPAVLLSLSPNVSGQSPTGYVFLSQYAGVLSRANNQADSEYLIKEKQSIDEKFGEGTFDVLLTKYNCFDSILTIGYFKKNSFQGRTKQAVLFENNDFVLGKVLSAAAKHPVAYLKHKACNFSYTLQKSKITYNTWGLIEPGPDKPRERLNIQFNSQLPRVKAAYVAMLDKMLKHPLLSLLFRHYIFLALSVVFLIVGALTRKPEFLVPSAFSVVYPVGLIIPDSFPHWRYLFVCYVLAWICLLAAGNLLVIWGWQWWQRQQDASVDA